MYFCLLQASCLCGAMHLLLHLWNVSLVVFLSVLSINVLLGNSCWSEWSTPVSITIFYIILVVSIDKDTHHALTCATIHHFLLKSLRWWQLFYLMEIKQLRHNTSKWLFNFRHNLLCFLRMSNIVVMYNILFTLLTQVTSIIEAHHYKIVRITLMLLILRLLTNNST